jgi:formate C-acetyltransferase
LNTTYLNKYSSQLVVTLGGVLPSGESAVSEVTMMFLRAIDRVRLPEPEFNLRIHSSNPPEFLELASKLTVSGCNFVSYYNDDALIANLAAAGLDEIDARSYAFDLCQDINVPGKGDFFYVCNPMLANLLMELLVKGGEYADFDALLSDYQAYVAQNIAKGIDTHNRAQSHLYQYRDGQYDAYFEGIRQGLMPSCRNKSPMAPLPMLSALYYGSIEAACDMIYEPYPIRARGVFFGTATEAINSLAAIKHVVYDTKQATLAEVVEACKADYTEEGQELLRQVLLHAPKWGNDDDDVDAIACKLIEFCLNELTKYRTSDGGVILGGIHQPHPVPTGKNLMATPEGRRAGAPVAVTLTPESGTASEGATATLNSAAKPDWRLCQWNMCVMVNYYASVFKDNEGDAVFRQLLTTYFAKGGLQHQPNVLDVKALRAAQDDPDAYRDLIVRLWGVSAVFVDLPRELQDEMIARAQQ